MGRNKTFDRDDVLEKALGVFWQKGYESTSLQDLTREMGIGRASLYDTFGNKHRLFAEAMDRYSQKVEEEVLCHLRAPGPAREVLTAFLHGAVEHFLTPGATRTCLAVKAALAQVAEEEPETAERIQALCRRMEDAFHDLLERARAEGALAPGKDPRAHARLLTAVMQGLNVTASLQRDRRVLLDVVESVVSAVF